MDYFEQTFMNMDPNDMLEHRIDAMGRSYHETPQYSRPKIQKVVNELRERKDYTSHYLPKVVSMGPIHHGNPELQIGENYKIIWAQKYIKKTGHNSKDLYRAIADNLAELKRHFAENVLTMDMVSNPGLNSFRSSDEKLVWMLFVDGCSLLYILDIDKYFEDENEEKFMKLVVRDVLLLENQLPFRLLGLLTRDNFNLSLRISSFLKYNNIVGSFKEVVNEDVKRRFLDTAPSHLLDVLRGILLSTSTQKKKVNLKSMMIDESIRNNNIVKYMNIQDLKSNGIRIKSNRSRILSDTDFSQGWLEGELLLSEIVLDEITVTTFLNLIAYEMSCDFQNDYGIVTFVTLIDSLIRQPEDVKDLRSAGILLSNFGNDEELIKLIRFIATDVQFNAETYPAFFGKMNKHIAKWNTNTVRFLRYIRHPWTNIAVHATELAPALTLIQTLFTINPVKS